MYFDNNINCCYIFLASGDFCHLLITFAKGLDAAQDEQIVSPDLDTNCLIVLLKHFFNKLILKEESVATPQLNECKSTNVPIDNFSCALKN